MVFSPRQIEHRFGSKGDFLRYFKEQRKSITHVLTLSISLALRPAQRHAEQRLFEVDLCREEASSLAKRGQVDPSATLWWIICDQHVSQVQRRLESDDVLAWSFAQGAASRSRVLLQCTQYPIPWFHEKTHWKCQQEPVRSRQAIGRLRRRQGHQRMVEKAHVNPIFQL